MKVAVTADIHYGIFHHLEGATDSLPELLRRESGSRHRLTSCLKFALFLEDNV